MASRRIGEFLVAEGLLTDAGVRRALSFQRLSGDRIRLGSILLHWDLLGEEALLTTLSKLHRCPAVPWAVLRNADIETVRLLPALRAIQYGAIPYALDHGALRVAFRNPGDLSSVDAVAAVIGRRVLPGVTTEIRLFQAHQRFYRRDLPLEFRAIAAKLERKTTGARKSAPWELDLDFRGAHGGEPGEVREFPSRYGGSVVPIPILREESPAAVEVPGAALPGPLPPTALLDPRAREEVARTILGSAVPQFSRVILFGAEEYGVVAWGGRGRDLTSDRIASIRVARGERSLFSAVEGGAPHFGAVKREDWPASLALALGAAPPECAVFAIRFLERIVGYLYADRLGEPMRREDFSLVARAAAVSTDVFSRAVRRGSVTSV